MDRLSFVCMLIICFGHTVMLLQGGPAGDVVATVFSWIAAICAGTVVLIECLLWANRWLGRRAAER